MTSPSSRRPPIDRLVASGDKRYTRVNKVNESLESMVSVVTSLTNGIGDSNKTMAYSMKEAMSEGFNMGFSQLASVLSKQQRQQAPVPASVAQVVRSAPLQRGGKRLSFAEEYVETEDFLNESQESVEEIDEKEILRAEIKQLKAQAKNAAAKAVAEEPPIPLGKRQPKKPRGSEA